MRVLSLGAPPRPPRDDLVKRLKAAGIEVRFGNARRWLQFPQVLRWLRSELVNFAPDLVQSMLWHANVLSALALRGNRAKLVGGMRVSEPRRLRWRIERWCAGRMSKLVCVSDDVRQHARVRQGIAEEKLLSIPNGISVMAAQAVPKPDWPELGVPAGKQVLLFVGRLEKQKGVLQLAEHLPEMLACLPNWQVVFIGTGSQQSRLQTSVANAGLADDVHLAGWQSNAWRWMQACDIVLLPAIYEGMPNVLLEAMAVGKPFVAFAVDGVRQIVQNDYPAELAEAQLAEAGDWTEFHRLVRRLASDPRLQAACGEANRQHVFKYFRIQDQLAQYEALYLQLVNRAANSRLG